MAHAVFSKEYVLSAMQQGGSVDALRTRWGKAFDDLVNYLAIATAPTHVGLEILREEINRNPAKRTLVLSGGKCDPKPINEGMAATLKVLAPVSAMGESRSGREPNSLAVIYSGGVMMGKAFGETTGGEMKEDFDRMTESKYSRVVFAESACLNTGDQGRALSGIAFARRTQRIVVVHVLDHIARFAATVAAGLKDAVDAKNAYLKAFASTHPDLDIKAHLREMPEFFFVGCGTWDSQGTAPVVNRAQEAFGPLVEGYPGKTLGEEYVSRYHGEQDPIKSLGYACNALTPSTMLQLIPDWVRTV